VACGETTLQRLHSNT